MNIDLNRAIEVLQACGYECEEITSMRQQLTAALAKIATLEAEKFESGNNQTIFIVRITELRQQLTAALDEARMAKVSADEVRSTYAEEMRKLSQQLASRDAEVAKWKDAYLKVVERIHMVGGYQDQSKERDQLREQETLLREALLTLRGKALYLDFQFDTGAVDEALAATEPKP